MKSNEKRRLGIWLCTGHSCHDIQLSKNHKKYLFRYSNMFATRAMGKAYFQLDWIQRLVFSDNPSPGFKHLIRVGREVYAKLPESMLVITVHSARTLRCRPTAVCLEYVDSLSSDKKSLQP